MILSSGYCWHKLVHCWMQEMYYSTKRQQFLIDQGYSFKVSFLSESPHKTSIWCISLELYSYIVCEQWNYSQIITSLPPSDSGPELSYHRLDEQLALLSKVSLLSWLTIEFIRLMSQTVSKVVYNFYCRFWVLAMMQLVWSSWKKIQMILLSKRPVVQSDQWVPCLEQAGWFTWNTSISSHPFLVFFFFPQKVLGMYIISQIAKTISFYLFILQYFMLQWLFKSPIGYFAASSCQPLILSTNDIVVYLVAAPVGVSLGMARSKVSRRILQRDMSCLKGDLDKLFWKSSRYVLLMHSLPIVIATLCSWDFTACVVWGWV